MSKSGKLNVALVGLKFGGAFPAIYRDHPDVAEVSVCDSDPAVLAAFADKHGVARRFSGVDEILAADDVDAVHIITPIHSHAELTLRVLNAGKHCACTVPMGTTLDELRAIVRAERASGKRYMMMETAVYTYHCLQAQAMIASGEIGRVQFLRGAHYQDMEHWPAYWHGLPPMHYATHAIAPLLVLAGDARATRVQCLGSGFMRESHRARYGNPFPVETALFKLDNGLAAEATRSLFHCAHEYAELFTLYGEDGTYEWQMENEMPVVYRAGPVDSPRGRGMKVTREPPPNFADRLPESIRKYCGHAVVADPNNPHQSVMQGGDHHGSHPHMVHEFVRAIVEDKPARSDAATAANWTAAGICAHESAMQDGAAVEIPDFRALDRDDAAVAARRPATMGRA